MGLRCFHPHAGERFYQHVALFVAPVASFPATRPGPAPILPRRRSRVVVRRSVDRRVERELRWFQIAAARGFFLETNMRIHRRL